MKIFKTTLKNRFVQITSLFTFGLFATVVFQNCSKSSFMAANNSSVVDENIVLSNGGCRFTGGAVENGKRVWAYQNSGVPAGSQCVVEERECTDGTLSGSFNFRTCAVGAPSACIFNGEQIDHGDSVDAFETSTVAFDKTCVQQSRQCQNGTLSGTFQFGSCNPGDPAACLFNGNQIAHDAPAIRAYKTSTVAYDKQCEYEMRKCTNGSLSGSFRFNDCNPGTPEGCIHNGQSIPHGGETGFLYTKGSVPYGSQCPAAVKRLCTDGDLSNPSAVFATCSAESQPTCSEGQVFNNTSMRCEFCANDKIYSASTKTCVSTCNGGVIIRLRATNTASISTAQNPIAFNFDAGFTISRNGTDYVVGKPNSTTFLNKMNLAVSQNTEYEGVREAYQAGINEVPGLAGVNVTIGNSFTFPIQVDDARLELPGREIVLSGTGNFLIKSYIADGWATPSGQHTRIIWCK